MRHLCAVLGYATKLLRAPTTTAAEDYRASLTGLGRPYPGTRQRCDFSRLDNRSVVGIMNEFSYLGDAYRLSNDVRDLVALSHRLSETPCGPLYARRGSPDREFAAFAAQHRW